MPIDPRIPLMAKSPQEIQQEMYKNQLLQLQAQQGQQEMQERNALMNIFRQPGALDDSGMPTQATLGRIYQASPEAGMKISNNLALMEERRQQAITNNIHQRLLGMQVGAKQHDRLVEIATSAQTRYDDLVAAGTPPAEAARIVGKERNQAVTEAQQDGTLLPSQGSQFQGAFNPEGNKAFIVSSPQYKRILDERNAFRKEKLAEDREERMLRTQEDRANRPESDIGKLEYDRRRGYISEQDYKDAVTNKTKGQDQATIDETAKMIANYDMAPLSAAALRSPSGQKIMARVAELNPNYNAQEFKSRQSSLVAFTSGKKGDTVRSLNVSLDHLDTLSEAGKDLKNGNVKAFNRIAQKIAEETGSSVPTNFDGVKQIVADEVIKGIIGAGGGVADREHAQAIFDRAKSPEQLVGAVTEIKKLLRGQLKGLEKQYKATTGRDDFEERFLTDSAKELDKGTGSTSPSKVARPKSKAEYDALPSGTRVILPNGKEGVKP